jgi:hypothetical protein
MTSKDIGVIQRANYEPMISHPPATPNIPLSFWFNKSTGLALPWVCIPENVRINILFRSVEELSNPELLKK